jgi:hypothetical protein
VEDGIERVDDGIEVIEHHYDPVAPDELPTLTPLTVVLPDRWGDTTGPFYGIEHGGPGYSVQAETGAGGCLGLWASRRWGQPDEPVVLFEDAGLRVTWSPERRRARVTVGNTSVFVTGDGIEVAQFETVLRSLRVLER